MNDRATKLQGIDAGADDFLTKPFNAAELQVRTRVLLRERALNLKLDGAESVILALARVVEARDLYTVHHAERVGRYSRTIGQAYGLDEPTDLDALYRGGVLHDLGKAVIPSEILLKNGPLTPEEWAIMRTHSAAGERICQPLKSTAAYLSMIRHHHERFDGAGYPDRLGGEDIPLAARIAAVAQALVVDDSRIMREALAHDLTELGYEVRTAVDGAEGLRAVAADQPDLVVSDVNMPLLDGIGLCRAVKNNPALRFIPVVARALRIARIARLLAVAHGFPQPEADLLYSAGMLLDIGMGAARGRRNAVGSGVRRCPSRSARAACAQGRCRGRRGIGVTLVNQGVIDRPTSQQVTGGTGEVSRCRERRRLLSADQLLQQLTSALFALSCAGPVVAAIRRLRRASSRPRTLSG